MTDARPVIARDGGLALPTAGLGGWQMAGRGRFVALGDGVLRSDGGPGVLWYTEQEFADFVLSVDWRVSSAEDNSGIFVRIPRLGVDDPERDWRPAADEGYEVQIDERGVDHEAGVTGSALHRTGAIYRLAPATAGASRPIGQWNTFVIEARGDDLAVTLNGVAVSRLAGGGRRRHGYVGLQNHHDGSAVEFRNVLLRRS